MLLRFIPQTFKAYVYKCIKKTLNNINTSYFFNIFTDSGRDSYQGSSQNF